MTTNALTGMSLSDSLSYLIVTFLANSVARYLHV